jgi:hypothetical protein
MRCRGRIFAAPCSGDKSLILRSCCECGKDHSDARASCVALDGAPLESLCRKEIVGHKSRPFCNYRRTWVLLKQQADEWYAIEAESNRWTAFQNDLTSMARCSLSRGFSNAGPITGSRLLPSQLFPLMCAPSRAKKRVNKGLRLSPECSTNAEQKRKLKLPRDYEAMHETRGLKRRETKNKGGIANETRNQCARKRTGSRQPARRGTRRVPLPKQRAKLHYCREVRSFDRLRTDAHRKGDPGAGSIDALTRAVVRHENQPLNWSRWISWKLWQRKSLKLSRKLWP